MAETTTARALVKTTTPGIYKRGSRYVVKWKHRGKQHKSFHRTMAEAREAKRLREGGDRRKRSRIHFRDYAAEWIENYRGRTNRGFSETTRVEYRRDVDQNLIPFFGGFWLHEIEPPDVRDWMAWMEGRGASVSAIRKAKAALSALYATAKQDGTVRDNPATGVRYVPSATASPPLKRRPLTMDELTRFMEELPAQWRLFFFLMAHSALRVGEMLGLTWRDVALGDDAHLTIREQVYRGQRKALKSKNAYRAIPLSPGMARALTEWRDRTDYPEPDSPLFPSQVGTPLDYSSLYHRVWVPAREAAGIPAGEVGAFHAFRRTLSSLVYDGGHKTDRQLCDWMGHHDPAFTVREYVGTMDQGIGAADFLDGLIPVEEWAPLGHPNTHEAPQTDDAENQASRRESSENGDQPQTAASAEPIS